MESEVTVYTISACSSCTRAKALLTDKGILFKEVYLDRNDDQARGELEKRSGMKTFPQIFFGEKLIGGYMDLLDYLK